MKQRAGLLCDLVREDLIREHKKDLVLFLHSTSLPDQNTNRDRNSGWSRRSSFWQADLTSTRCPHTWEVVLHAHIICSLPDFPQFISLLSILSIYPFYIYIWMEFIIVEKAFNWRRCHCLAQDAQLFCYSAPFWDQVDKQVQKCHMVALLMLHLGG